MVNLHAQESARINSSRNQSEKKKGGLTDRERSMFNLTSEVQSNCTYRISQSTQQREEKRYSRDSKDSRVLSVSENDEEPDENDV